MSNRHGVMYRALCAERRQGSKPRVGIHVAGGEVRGRRKVDQGLSDTLDNGISDTTCVERTHVEAGERTNISRTSQLRERGRSEVYARARALDKREDMTQIVQTQASACRSMSAALTGRWQQSRLFATVVGQRSVLPKRPLLSTPLLTM